MPAYKLPNQADTLFIRCKFYWFRILKALSDFVLDFQRQMIGTLAKEKQEPVILQPNILLMPISYFTFLNIPKIRM